MQPTLWDDTEQLLDQWRAWQVMQNLSHRTIDERLVAVRAMLAMDQVTPRTMTPMSVIRFCGRESLSASSRHTYHTTVRAFCAWLVRVGVRPDDPTDHTPSPKRPRGYPRPLALSAVREILTAANRARTRAYIKLAVLAGMRGHEIAKVSGEDFDLERRSLTITGKGGKTQLVPLPDELVDLAHEMPRSGWWFPAYTIEGHVTRSAVYSAIKGAMRRAGYPDAVPHMLRHSYGTELLRAGVDVRVVQELMRHENLTTTQIYTQVDWELMVAAVSEYRLAA